MIKVLFSSKAEKIYQKLKDSKLKEDRILLKAIDTKVLLIKSDPQIGDQIRKKSIPKELKVHNLFRIALPCYWRMLYTLERDNVTIIAFVIDITTHKQYDRIMKY
ncbi:MAG: hypothetical protein ACMXYE_03305 [Candidatus Woesearchaeota archaeon]